MDSSTYLEQNRAPRDMGIIVSLAFLATVAVAGRLASRKVKNVPWAIDDWAAVVGLLLAWLCCALSIVCYHFGAGRHIQAVSPTNIVHFEKALFSLNQVYNATPPVIKMSILLVYKRIFPVRRIILAFYIMSTFIVLWWLSFGIVGFFICIPIRGYWGQSVRTRCVNLKYFSTGYTVCNIFSDIIILVLPVPIVWSLHLPRIRKIALIFIFMLGSFACVAALVRLLSAILTLNNPDVTWDYADGILWSSIEPSVGAMCSSLPTLNPIISYLIPANFHLRRYNSSFNARTLKKSVLSYRNWPKSTRQFFEVDDNCLRLDGISLAGERIRPRATEWSVDTGGQIDLEMADEWTNGQIQVQHEVEVKHV